MPDWNKNSKITFEEEKYIKEFGKQLAKIYFTRTDKYDSFDDIRKFTNRVFRDKNVADYVYDETIKSLKEDYDICPRDISI